MKLTVIGSSSRGNCYALQSSTETLVLEAGCKLASFKKVLNYQYRPIVGVLASHSHGDHAKYLKEYSSLGAVIGSTPDVVERYGLEATDTPLQADKTTHIGSFSVTPFSVYHDVPTYGYLIRHPEMGTLLFATDTFALPYVFKNVNHWLIEANYADPILEDNLAKGVIDHTQYKRILTSHMSLENCIKNLQLCDAVKSARTITLIHLSARNSDANLFRDSIESKFAIPCYIAKRGLEINLNK